VRAAEWPQNRLVMERRDAVATGERAAAKVCAVREGVRAYACDAVRFAAWTR
jgi:hypothetical protein